MNINRIRADIAIAKMSCSPVTNPTNDEYFYDVGAYHVQQAIEKCLKFYLHDIYGMSEYDPKYRNHIISSLLLQLNKFDDTFLKRHQGVVEMADQLTDWEASCRYGGDIVATRRAVEKCIVLAEELYTEILELEAERYPDLEAEIEEEQ